MSDQLSLTGSLHLIVAWGTGASSIARLVKTTDDVTAALRQHAQNAVDRLTDLTPYAPDADLEDNSHMEAPADDSIDTALIQELRRGPSLPLATDDELRSKPLKCHAVHISNPDGTTLFVKKRTPIQLATKSVVATLLNGSLDRLESPIFAFDNRYDAIITAKKVYVLDKKAFEGLFKESPAVLAKTSDWIKEVSASVPFAPGSAEALDEILKKNSVLRNKFLSVRGRLHLKVITPQELRDEMIRYGYDPADLMEGETLMVTSQNVKTVLRLLNEDLFTGGFSQMRYAAGSKRSIN